MNKNIEELTDLELAQALNQIYGQVMNLQNNLLAINAEIDKRKKAKEEVK